MTVNSPEVPATTWPELYPPNAGRVAVLQQAYDCQVQDALLTASGGQEVLNFHLPINDPKGELLDDDMLVVFNGNSWRISSITDGWDGQGNNAYIVKCEGLWYDLGETGRITTPAQNQTAGQVLATALSGTGWSVGTISTDLSTQSDLFPAQVNTNALAMVRAVPAVFGGELQFDNAHQTVSLLDQRGVNAGAFYAHGSNLTSDLRVRDSAGLVTRLYPVGAHSISPSSVNGGLDYVEDYTFYTSRGWPERVRVATLTNNALTTPSQVLAWGQAQLAVLSQPALSYTVVSANVRSAAVPGLGDTVRVWDATLGLDASTRVVARTIYPLEPGKDTLTFNSALWTLAQQLGPGNSPGSGGPPPVDTVPPATPTGVNVTVYDGFNSQGNRQIYAEVQWNAVTTDADGNPEYALDHYVVQYQVDVGNWIPLGDVTASQTAVDTPPLIVKNSINARVAAVDHAGNVSGFGSYLQSAPADNTPPGVPSTLSLNTTALPLAIEATWDGKDSTGAAMLIGAPDFAFLEVHQSAISSFSPSASSLIDIQTSALGGTSVAPLLTPGTTYYFLTIAVDRAGNRSAASAEVSGAVPTIANAGPYFANASIADALIGSLTAGKITAGTLSSVVTISGRIATANTGARVELNSTGLQSFNAGGTQTVGINNDGSAFFNGTINASGGNIAGWQIYTNELYGSTTSMITGGTVSAATIETASSGARAVLAPNGVLWNGSSYDGLAAWSIAGNSNPDATFFAWQDSSSPPNVFAQMAGPTPVNGDYYAAIINLDHNRVAGMFADSFVFNTNAPSNGPSGAEFVVNANAITVAVPMVHNANYIYLNGSGDTNNALHWNSGINGPQMNGYQNVQLEVAYPQVATFTLVGENNAGGAAAMVVSNYNVSFLMGASGSSGLYLRDGTGDNYVDGYALNWTNTSSVSLKEQISDLDEGWALTSLKAAPSRRWKFIEPANYRPQEGERSHYENFHFGAMAEDMPIEVSVDGGHVNLRNYTGWVHAAVLDLAKEVEQLRAAIKGAA